MGNRILQRDSLNGAPLQSPTALLSYTAEGQLFFSMTPTASPGWYDYNWHSYDGAGRRVVTLARQGGTWSPGTDTSSGNRTHYVYDGSDVALMLVRNGGAWWVQSRFVVGGVDQPLGGWFATSGGAGPENLVFVNDYQGSTRAAVRANGTREDQAQYFSRNAFGSLEGPNGTGGSYNTQTGFGGASTPNATGGFTYLRNRWYDPATGRFLTQDPIGLAGGVNLYAYAGNNPVAFDDPFGLDCRLQRTSEPCPGLKDMVSGWGTALRMLGEFIAGKGPAQRYFGQGSVQAREMQTAPGVNEARRMFYDRNAPALLTGSHTLQGVAHVAGFGASGYVAATTSPTRQFLGGYTVNVSPSGDGDVRIAVENVTSMHSALLHSSFVHNHERAQGAAGGNIRQTIEWTEPITHP